jgi:phospholipid/cholesterol/gamma-HCH transport system permease protein
MKTHRARLKCVRMTGSALHQWLTSDQGLALHLAGDWRGPAAASLSAPPPSATLGRVQVDGAALDAWDGGLAAALRSRLAPLARAGHRIELAALPADVRAVLELALPRSGSAPLSAPPPLGGLERLGRWSHRQGRQALATAQFVGEVLLALLRAVRGGSGLRRAELWRQIDATGPLSLPIVTLTCFLTGLMLAYMGGAQLDRIGAQRHIADVVTVGMVRELAGLMTGIILAGRVGASFAAQLATMKAGEEIDALRALGVEPMDHLVLPRLLALVAVAPLLWAYAALVGTLAGLPAVVLAYGVRPAEYLHAAGEALTWTHLWVGCLKCMIYAALVALAGCREGLAAGRNAQAVGEATTRAVVKALVWIVAAACASTIVIQSLGF